MADVADLAEIELGLMERERQDRISRTHCAECDDEIPQARRVAVPGVRLCIDCQQLGEMRHG